MTAAQPIAGIGFLTAVGDGDLAAMAESLEVMTELGADAAELSLWGEEVIAGGRVLPERARRLVELTRRFPLRYSVHGQVSSNFMDAAHLDLQKAVVRAMLELCDQLGASVLVHHGGTAPMPDEQEERARLDAMERAALAELAEVARGYGVRLVLENIFAESAQEYRQTPAEVAATVRTVGHPHLAGLIDFSHAYIESTRRGLDWREQIRAMAPVTGHLHVHDSFGRPYSMTRFYHPAEATALGIGDLHLPLGWGDIPWEDIFGELAFLPDTLLILEIDPAQYRSELAESLARARRLAALRNGRPA
ncbi:TIM barrel protein [Marinivivus vitaminiproducens]|uniref:TIM barrel protein n=1 Tax=Marinivivus vitaminiproducens TaxID=3035935 RepID=UPI0027A22541|nr:TIM barrel protein [Geminicoccaceae bacterium SCSIO 64248]